MISKEEKPEGLTKDEWELVTLIRLYHSAYPNGQFNYEWLIDKQIQKMLDRDIEKED